MRDDHLDACAWGLLRPHSFKEDLCIMRAVDLALAKNYGLENGLEACLSDV